MGSRRDKKKGEKIKKNNEEAKEFHKLTNTQESATILILDVNNFRFKFRLEDVYLSIETSTVSGGPVDQRSFRCLVDNVLAY